MDHSPDQRLLPEIASDVLFAEHRNCSPVRKGNKASLHSEGNADSLLPEWHIPEPDMALGPEIRSIIDEKTKPLGALGRLEDLAYQIAFSQGRLQPALQNPHILVFAGDHGITDEGISAYPKEVTHQMVLNFLAGGAAINVFARQHQIGLKIIDAGVDHDFGTVSHPDFISAKAGRGTANALHDPAMGLEQYIQAIKSGTDIVDSLYDSGCNVIGFGEMGIGNTTAASILTSALTRLSPEVCTGRGTGLNDIALKNKAMVVRGVLERIEARWNGRLVRDDDPDSPTKATGNIAIGDLLCESAGFEMAMMFGAMLQAGARGMMVLVDGFISTSVYMAAARYRPALKHYAIFSHLSDEAGHAVQLQALGAKPLLHLGMRLGEGSGCAVAWPLLVSAVNMMNEMAGFSSAGISRKQNPT